MDIEIVLLLSSILIMLILLAILVALSFRVGDNPKKAKKVSQDLKKIKDQINGDR